MFNEIDDDFDNVAIKTFNVGLPAEHGLRKSLTEKPTPMCTNSWIELISIKGSRKTTNRVRGKLSYPSRDEGF